MTLALPAPLSHVLEYALYDDEVGFYATGGAAGRRGDFLTSPEVGPLFGAVVARALDTWWRELGEPEEFTVIDAGAGPGTLGRAVVAASPACLGSLRYMMVERSGAQRAKHPIGAVFESRRELPDDRIIGVVVANELLDNIPFDLLVHDGSWKEAWVDRSTDGRLVEVLRPVTSLPDLLPDLGAHGARAPRQAAAAHWVRRAVELIERGRVVAIDYTSTTGAMATRPWREWLRTYRGHERGRHYLSAIGEQDVTCEVAVDQLPPADAVHTQAQWLRRHGIDDLVAEGRAQWNERRGTADLAALRARSRVREAEALCDPAGLGSFTVLEWSGASSRARPVA